MKPCKTTDDGVEKTLFLEHYIGCQSIAFIDTSFVITVSTGSDNDDEDNNCNNYNSNAFSQPEALVSCNKYPS